MEYFRIDLGCNNDNSSRIAFIAIILKSFKLFKGSLFCPIQSVTNFSKYDADPMPDHVKTLYTLDH